MIEFIGSDESKQFYRIVESDSGYLIGSVEREWLPKVKVYKPYNLTIEENFINIGLIKTYKPVKSKKFHLEMNQYEYEEI